jgi:hypothetical protein
METAGWVREHMDKDQYIGITIQIHTILCVKARYSCQILTKLAFFSTDYFSINHNVPNFTLKNPSKREHGRTDIATLIVDFRDFANATKHAAERI